jgi:hypothetical protein
VATANLYAPAYWTAVVLAAFIPVTVLVSRRRTTRRASHA